MKITISNKPPETKTLNELTEGEIFKMTERCYVDYFIKTNMVDYDHNNEIICINLKTGESKRISPIEQVTPVEAELNIFQNKDIPQGEPTMTKYVIVKYDGDKILTPHIYSDEQFAWVFYADMVLSELGEYIDIDYKDYNKYQNIFKTKDTDTIKKNLLKLIDKYNKQALDENGEYIVSDIENGYYFGDGKYETIVQIFEVKENTSRRTSDILNAF